RERGVGRERHVEAQVGALGGPARNLQGGASAEVLRGRRGAHVRVRDRGEGPHVAARLRHGNAAEGDDAGRPAESAAEHGPSSLWPYTCASPGRCVAFVFVWPARALTRG